MPVCFTLESWLRFLWYVPFQFSSWPLKMFLVSFLIIESWEPRGLFEIWVKSFFFNFRLISLLHILLPLNYCELSLNLICAHSFYLKSMPVIFLRHLSMNRLIDCHFGIGFYKSKEQFCLLRESILQHIYFFRMLKKGCWSYTLEWIFFLRLQSTLRIFIGWDDWK